MLLPFAITALFIAEATVQKTSFGIIAGANTYQWVGEVGDGTKIDYQKLKTRVLFGVNAEIPIASGIFFSRNTGCWKGVNNIEGSKF